MSDLSMEMEAGYYWRTASEARRIRREQGDHHTVAQQEDLESIVINSEWPKLKAAAGTAIAELQGAVVVNDEEQACESLA